MKKLNKGDDNYDVDDDDNEDNEDNDYYLVD